MAGAVDRLEPGVAQLACQLLREREKLGPVGVADDEQRRHVQLPEAGLRRRLRPDGTNLPVDGELLVLWSAFAPEPELQPASTRAHAVVRTTRDRAGRRTRGAGISS